MGKRSKSGLQRGNHGRRRAELVEQWQRSGKSKAAFCREHGLRYYTFVGWTRAVKIATVSQVQETSDRFVQVITGQPPSDTIFARIVLRSCSIEIFHPVDASFLKNLAGS